MNLWVYLRLVVLTAGTLLPLFWMVVILGHRRQRNFERIFFFLCLALFFFFGSSLLALNARLYYAAPPAGLLRFCWAFLCISLWLFPSLLLHLHVEYAEIRGLIGPGKKRLAALAVYTAAPLVMPALYFAMTRSAYDWLVPSRALGSWSQAWIVAALAIAAIWQWRFYRMAPDAQQRTFHRALAADFFLLSIFIALLHATRDRGQTDVIGAVLGILALGPFAVLIGKVQRFNFLQIGRQQNLIYAVSLVFVALLYLGFVRRVSTWTESYLPPEATAAILLFLPVLFFEPLQRLMRGLLQSTAHKEMDRAQRLIGPISEMARFGNPEKLRSFSEVWIREQLQLAGVELSFRPAEAPTVSSSRHGLAERFPIRQADREIGVLSVQAHGAMLSGETYAALQFVCEQLPGAIDLCRLIEEKLRLERELAERERLALVGQMAASISHNLKNPLGSMKTILQLQLENPVMPVGLRSETKMLLDEVGRLSAKLNQLLQFSRPTVRSGESRAQCDSWTVAEQVMSVLRPEADRRGVHLELAERNGLGTSSVNLSGEALNDILSNLVVNAIEASGHAGSVRVSAESSGGKILLAVEDDGPGIPEAAHDKILQPFFTTKSQGTGLGLAIVARRVADGGGELRWQSPVRDGRGARFVVALKAIP